jgi:hypothetical protein
VYAELVGSAEGENIPSGTQGAVGLTYGPVLFVLQWIVRGTFVVAFGAFSLYWFYHWDKEWFDSFVVLSAVAMGVGVVATALVSAFLNPGRVFTYFAIPYALAYAGGLFFADRFLWFQSRRTLLHRLSTDRIRALARVLAAVVLVVMLFSTMMKFPADVIGDPEPIREEGRVDDLPYLEIDAPELTARSFVHRYHRPGERIEAVSGANGDFYRSGAVTETDPSVDPSRGYVVGGVRGSVITSESAAALLYDNGEARVYYRMDNATTE